MFEDNEIQLITFDSTKKNNFKFLHLKLQMPSFFRKIKRLKGLSINIDIAIREGVKGFVTKVYEAYY